MKEKNIIWFNAPELPGAPISFNAIIHDEHDKKVLWIENNVWHGSSSAFDIEFKSGTNGGSIKIRRKRGEVIFDLEINPPSLMDFRALTFWSAGSRYDIRTSGKGMGEIRVNNAPIMMYQGMVMSNSPIGIWFN